MTKLQNGVLSSLLATAAFLLLANCSDDPAGPDVQVPVLSTGSVSEITQTTAQCGGNITSDGGATVTARGVCWSSNATSTIADSKTVDGTGPGSFTSSITGLTAIATYYVRAYATNSAGTSYGSAQVFTTTDIDGNVYETVTIGTQEWMAENLRVTRYRNGDPIPNVTNSSTWTGLTTGAYCEYDNEITNVAVYGRLYNWYAVNDSRKLAPAGWHVPSHAEWQTLVDHIGGSAVAGGRMKEVGTAHWLDPNTGATNESGFSALPAGIRFIAGDYYYLGTHTNWWSSTEPGSHEAWNRWLVYNSAEINLGYNNYKHYGFSVRCVRD